MEIRTSAPGAPVRADRARRTITGLVVPWGSFARVSTGQNVGFARGSLTLSDRAKLVLDHDPAQPVAVYQSATDTGDGLEATFRVPEGPAGDQVLAQAQEGLRDGLSVAADIAAADERDDGLWVTQARGRHVALLSEPAFDTARVTAVAASQPTGEPPMTTTAPTTTTTTTAQAPAPAQPAPAGELTAAAILPTAAASAPAPGLAAGPARTRDPYPYAQPHLAGGPSFVRDAWEAMENPGSDAADRWRRAAAMRSEATYIRAAIGAFYDVAAAGPPGITPDHPGLATPHYRPDRFVPLKAAKAPLWSAITKWPTPDFNPIMVPRTTDESGLSGHPPDEVTPIAPGNVATDVDTITPTEIEGAYTFSRKLLLGSNPQIDTIALNAMERAWLNDVEDLAVAYFLQPAYNTAVAGTYADADGYLDALQATMADMATGPFTPTDIVPARKEFTALATAKDSTGRPLLPEGPRLNAPGESSPGYSSLMVQGVPMWPGRSVNANKTFVLDQASDAAVAWVTPVMNFRLEWTSDAATGGNVKVLKLVKYSGVGFWAQYVEGITVITNSTPLPLDGGRSGTGEKKTAGK